MTVKPLPYQVFTKQLTREYVNTRESLTATKMKLVSTIVGELMERSLDEEGNPTGPLVRAVMSTSDLTADLVQLYIESRRDGIKSPDGSWLRKPVGQNTIIGELGYLKALCNFAVDMDPPALERCPFKPRKRLLKKAPLIHRTHLSCEDIARLLEYCEQGITDWRRHRLYALVGMYAYTGVRRNEALFAMLEDLDLDQSILFIQDRDENRVKTEKSAAPVGLPPELVRILRPWVKRTASPWIFPGIEGVAPWFHGRAKYRPLETIQAAAIAAGICAGTKEDRITIQMFRHSFATSSEDWGIDEQQLKRQLRHTNVDTQKHYRHSELRQLAAAVKNVSFRRTAG